MNILKCVGVQCIVVDVTTLLYSSQAWIGMLGADSFVRAGWVNCHIHSYQGSEQACDGEGRWHNGTYAFGTF